MKYVSAAPFYIVKTSKAKTFDTEPQKSTNC